MPLGTNKNTMRLGTSAVATDVAARAAAFATAGGIMLSSIGSAIAVPTPRKNVRRDNLDIKAHLLEYSIASLVWQFLA
jgi:hypothetical protein